MIALLLFFEQFHNGLSKLDFLHTENRCRERIKEIKDHKSYHSICQGRVGRILLCPVQPVHHKKKWHKKHGSCFRPVQLSPLQALQTAFLQLPPPGRCRVQGSSPLIKQIHQKAKHQIGRVLSAKVCSFFEHPDHTWQNRSPAKTPATTCHSRMLFLFSKPMALGDLHILVSPKHFWPRNQSKEGQKLVWSTGRSAGPSGSSP